MIKAILFDADYTLYQIQTEPAYRALYTFLEGALKIPADKIKTAHRAQVGKVKNSRDPAKREYAFALTWALERLHVDEAESLAQQGLQRFWETILADLSWEPNILETMGALKAKYRLAVTSDEFPENLERKLEKVFGHWQDFFEFLITPRETGEMKPSALYYQRALKKLERRPSEVLAVGDSWERDLKPARMQGLRTVLLSSEPEGLPDKRARTLRELVELLNA